MLCYVIGYRLWIRGVRWYQAGDEVCMWDVERRRRRRRRERVGWGLGCVHMASRMAYVSHPAEGEGGAYHRACVSPCVGR